MNPENAIPDPADFDWSRCTFEGARREKMRRWSEMPLDRLILALEEMEALAEALGAAPRGKKPG